MRGAARARARRRWLTRPRGFGVAAGLDEDVARELARRCESLGYASLWSNDHPMGSGLETVAVFADAAPSLDVGVAVMALDRHEPPRTAAQDGEARHPTRAAVARHRGRVHEAAADRRTRGARGDARRAARRGPAGRGRAMGPKMCALAGAEADGVFLNWMTPAKAAWARERVHEGAREAGVTRLRRSSATCASPSVPTPRSGS